MQFNNYQIFKVLLVIFCCITSSKECFSQNNNVGINTSTPHPSSALEIESKSQGVLIPRLTEIERDAIVNPALGLIIYNLTDLQEELYNGICWVPSYLESCDDCALNITAQQLTLVIDRVNSLTAQVIIDVEQLFPNANKLIEMNVLSDFSEETNVTLSNYSFQGTNQTTLNVETTIFQSPGDHYVTILGVCGSKVYAEQILIVIEPCIEVTISESTENYNLFDETGIADAQCFVVTVEKGVEIRSESTAIEAFSSGSISPGSKLGIINQGNIMGLGGAGSQNSTDSGETGGDAIAINCETIIRNENGLIYAGGGGGRATGFSYTIDLPWPIPDITLGIGSGGGGGMPSGPGGGSASVFPFWSAGDEADDNYGGSPGDGGEYAQEIGISVVAIEPEIIGGGGGDFGESGESGSVGITITADIPFIGSFTVYSDSFSIPLDGGDPGHAIKLNGATVNYPNAEYQNYSIRGKVE